MLKPLSFRSKVYNPRIRADSLVTQPISQSQAETRKQLLGASPSGSPVGPGATHGGSRLLAPQMRQPRLCPVSSRKTLLSVLRRICLQGHAAAEASRDAGSQPHEHGALHEESGHRGPGPL